MIDDGFNTLDLDLSPDELRAADRSARPDHHTSISQG
jgi:hypothetical protein